MNIFCLRKVVAKSLLNSSIILNRLAGDMMVYSQKGVMSFRFR